MIIYISMYFNFYILLSGCFAGVIEIMLDIAREADAFAIGGSDYNPGVPAPELPRGVPKQQ